MEEDRRGRGERREKEMIGERRRARGEEKRGGERIAEEKRRDRDRDRRESRKRRRG